MASSKQQNLQSSISSCLRLIKSLDKRLTLPPTLYIPLGSHGNDPQMTLSMLDWIASYFTNGSDTAAASITVDKNKLVTLHIACNNGSPSHEDTQKASKLVEAIRKLVTAGSTDIHTVGDRTGYNITRELLIDTCWATVWKKIVAVRDILREKDALTRFDSMIRSWLAYCVEEERTVNGSPLLNDVCKRTGKEFPLALMGILEELRDINEEKDAQKHAQRDWKINAFTVSGSNCEILLHSDIVMSALDYSDRRELSQNCGDDSSDSSADSEGDAKEQPDQLWTFSLPVGDFILLQRFVSAIQELYQYHIGALILGLYGVRLFKRFWRSDITTKPISELFSIAWVHEEHPLPARNTCTLHDSPMEWATSSYNMFYGGKFSTEERDVIEPLCRSLWMKGESLSGKVHEELAMALFIIQNRVQVYHGALGVSAPPCYTCGILCRYLYSDLLIRKRSNTVITDWIIPSSIVDQIVLDALKQASIRLQGSLRNVIIDFVEDSQRKKQGVLEISIDNLVSHMASYIKS